LGTHLPHIAEAYMSELGINLKQPEVSIKSEEYVVLTERYPQITDTVN